jgi:hypothetical protein
MTEAWQDAIATPSRRQEVLWSANENLKKVIHRESASARDGFGALAFVRLYIWPVLVKVVRN